MNKFKFTFKGLLKDGIPFYATIAIVLVMLAKRFNIDIAIIVFFLSFMTGMIIAIYIFGSYEGTLQDVYDLVNQFVGWRKFAKGLIWMLILSAVASAVFSIFAYQFIFLIPAVFATGLTFSMSSITALSLTPIAINIEKFENQQK